MIFRRTLAATAVSTLVLVGVAAGPALAKTPPRPVTCTKEVATGRIEDAWVPVGNIFAGADVTGKLVYASDRAAEMSVEGAVSVNGGSFKVSASEGRSVQITDTFEATDLRAGLEKRLRFVETKNRCTRLGKTTTLTHVRAAGFLPGWTTTAVRGAPRSFPYCNRFVSFTNRASYPTKVDWSKKIAYTEELSVSLSAWIFTAKVKTTQGNSLTLSYTSKSPGWVCWAGNPNSPTNMDFAATGK